MLTDWAYLHLLWLKLNYGFCTATSYQTKYTLSAWRLKLLPVMVSTGLSFNQYNADGTDKEDCFWIRPSFSTCPGSLAPSASFDAVCIMNMILNSAVLPRITSKNTIAQRLLDILPFLFQLVMAIEYLSDDGRRNFKNYMYLHKPVDSSSRRQQIIARRYILKIPNFT